MESKEEKKRRLLTFPSTLLCSSSFSSRPKHTIIVFEKVNIICILLVNINMRLNLIETLNALPLNFTTRIIFDYEN